MEFEIWLLYLYVHCALSVFSFRALLALSTLSCLLLVCEQRRTEYSLLSTFGRQDRDGPLCFLRASSQSLMTLLNYLLGRGWQRQLAVEAGDNICIILLVLGRNDPMSDEKIYHDKCAVRLEFCPGKAFPHFTNGHQIELFDLIIVLLADNTFGDFEVVNKHYVRSNESSLSATSSIV